MVTDRGGLHTDQVVDGDIHCSDRMVGACGQADRGTAYGVELITHAEVGAAVEERARDEVIATGQDQGVDIGIVITINECCEVRGRLGGQQARFTIGEMQKLQAIGDRKVHQRNNIVAFTGGNHAAGGIGGGAEEGDPLHPLGPGEQDGINRHDGIRVGHVEDSSHAGGCAL